MVINYYYGIYLLIHYKGITIMVNNNKKTLYIFLISFFFSLIIFNYFYKNIYF